MKDSRRRNLVMNTIEGLFKDLDDAHAAIDELHQAGFSNEQIGVITDEQALRRRAHLETGARDVAKDAAGSAAAGSAMGGLTGLLATLAAASIPGIGPALVAGGLAGPLIGGVGGAGVGGLIGALLGGSTDLQVNEEKAAAYTERIQHGGVLVSVLAEGVLVDQAQMIMERNGAIKV
jgi:hypothetical protein